MRFDPITAHHLMVQREHELRRSAEFARTHRVESAERQPGLAKRVALTLVVLAPIVVLAATIAPRLGH